MKKTIALVGTVLASGALLAGCGQSGDFDGEWSGDITATQEGSGGGSATISIDGGDCEWQMTETDGETNEANCLRDDKEFKLEDPLTHQDLKYDAERSGGRASGGAGAGPGPGRHGRCAGRGRGRTARS